MANYFVNLELSTSGGNGNSSRPFNSKEFIEKITTLSDNTFYVKGLKDFGSVISTLNCNGNAIVAWGPEPWRIKGLAASSMINLVKLEGGIFDTTQSNIFNINSKEIENTYIISNTLVVGTSSIIGSTICTGNAYTLELTGSTMNITDTTLCNKSDIGGYIHNHCTLELLFSNCAFETGDPNQNQTWNSNYIFTNASGNGIFFHECQFGWDAPVMPVWTAERSAFSATNLYSNISFPTEPGNLYPAFSCEKDLWRNNRTGIGAGDFLNTPVISVAPFIIQTTQNSTISEGSSLYLDVSSYGIPINLQYQWYRNGEFLIESDKYVGVNTRTLLIQNALIADSGNFYAIVSNGVSPNAQTNNIVVTVIVQQKFYVDLTGGTTIPAQGTGTESDPWNANGWQRNIGSRPYGSAIYLKGSCTFDNGITWNASNSPVYKAWDPETNGPWRMQFDHVGFGLAATTLEGGVIQQSSSMGFTQDTVLRSMYYVWSENPTITFNGKTYGCTFVTDGTWNLEGVHTDAVLVSTNSSNPINQQGSILNNCAISSVAGITGTGVMNDCQSDWVAPVMPSWDAPQQSFENIYATIETPPQPGAIPYVGYNYDLWGKPRTGMGADNSNYIEIDWVLQPQDSKLRYTTAIFEAQTNTAGKVYFVGKLTDPKPLDSFQVKAGKDEKGHVVAVGLSGSAIAIENQITTLQATNLESNVYDFYFVAEDNFGNIQAAPTKITIEIPKLLFVDPDKPGKTFNDVVLSGDTNIVSPNIKVRTAFRQVSIPKTSGGAK